MISLLGHIMYHVTCAHSAAPIGLTSPKQLTRSLRLRDASTSSTSTSISRRIPRSREMRHCQELPTNNRISQQQSPAMASFYLHMRTTSRPSLVAPAGKCTSRNRSLDLSASCLTWTTNRLLRRVWVESTEYPDFSKLILRAIMWIFSYWLLPFLSAVVWLGQSPIMGAPFCLLMSGRHARTDFHAPAMLLTMLIYWLARGRQMYPTMAAGQDVA